MPLPAVTMLPSLLQERFGEIKTSLQVILALKRPQSANDTGASPAHCDRRSNLGRCRARQAELERLCPAKAGRLRLVRRAKVLN